MSITRHFHILNLSALQELMAEPPKAQRLSQAINKGMLDRISKEQTENLIYLIEEGTTKTLEYIKTNSPHIK